MLTYTHWGQTRDPKKETITRDYPEVKTIVLLGTTGTIKGGLFQKRLGAQEKITTMVPDEAVQSTVMEAIYDIKNASSSRSRSDITADLAAAADSLIAIQPDGAQAIIAGCTEIPLALGPQHLSVPYFDSLTILARAAILRAGVTPAALS